MLVTLFVLVEVSVDGLAELAELSEDLFEHRNGAQLGAAHSHRSTRTPATAVTAAQQAAGRQAGRQQASTGRTERTAVCALTGNCQRVMRVEPRNDE